MGPNEVTNHPESPSGAAPSQPHMTPSHVAPSHAHSPLSMSVPTPAPASSHPEPANHTAPHAPVAPTQSPMEPQMGSHQRIKPSSPLFTLGVTSVIIVIVGWLLVGLLGLTRTSENGELEKKLGELHAELNQPAMVKATKDYTTIANVVSQVKQLRQDRLVFDPTWQTVKKNVPKDVQFTSFALGEDDTFRIVGVARSVTSVAQFAAALNQLGQFKTVTPLSVDKQADAALYNFTMSFKQGTTQ